MDKESSLVEHLEELRLRILISLAVLVISTCVAFPYASKVIAILKYPARGVIDRLAFFHPVDAFMAYFKVSFFVGLIVSMPVILYQLWVFVSPAIDEKIRKKGIVLLVSSTGMFLAGAAFGFFVLLPAAFKFLLSFSRDGLEPIISVLNYTSFVMGFILGCGVVFEMPILSYLLSKMGVINHIILRRAWKYALILIFIAAAVITPTPDVFNMTMMAIPMLLLYELSIWVSWFARIRR